MSKVVRSPQAEDDLLDIWLYIARDNVNAANRFIDELDETFETIAATPGIGVKRDNLMPGLRMHPFRRYLIFYFIIEHGINVVRVLSAYREREIKAAFGDE